MNLPSAVILTGLAAFSRLAAATSELPPPPAVPQPVRDIAILIRDLADDSYQVREKAGMEIWRLGEAALPALKDAAVSPDPEQGFRARDLIRKIQMHIGPDTDPTVIALVERYQKASPSEKTALLGRMKAKRAWRQMLKLYAAETSAEVREKLRPSLIGVAVRAARERLSAGDANGAREFLEMAPADSEGLLALAEFHRTHGTLDAELARAKAIQGRKSETWQLALQRAAGNITAARDLADSLGETRIAAAMAALAGDPLPWLREVPENADDDASTTAYCNIAAKRWLGEKIRPADLEPLARGLSVRDPSARGAAMNALFLLGEVELAEPVFAKTEPLAAFRHFESLERIPEALKALGLNPEKPDYQPWIEKRLEQLTKTDIEDQHGVFTHTEELVTLANFLERRGLLEEAFGAFSKPLATLADKDSGEFLDFLRQLFGNSQSLSGAPQLAKRIGMAWAGEEEKRWTELVTAAFGEDDQAADWWDWLADLDPKANRAGRFDGMLALFDLGSDPSGLREKWLALAWKAVADMPAGQRDKPVARISALCTQVGDVANCLKAWDLMDENARKDVFWGQHIVHLSAVERWNDAATTILGHISLFPEAKQELDVDDIHAHAYAASSLRLAGRQDDAATEDLWADQLTLGNPGLAIKMGSGYAFGRDYKRAGEWWRRAACEADPDSGEFIFALKLLADLQLGDGKWKEVAAISEVIARAYVSPDYRWENSLPLIMRQRLQADTMHALAILKDNRPAAISILSKCHHTFISDGSLADFFFPSLRKAGLIKEHDEWFGESWELMENIIRQYPESDNTRNTAAWFASRALRKLDEATKLLATALAANPDQPAYLDTMAEIQFAKGNREKAIEWSKTAINFDPDDSQLRRQQDRFRSDPLPK